MFQEMLESLSDTIAGGAREALPPVSAPSAEGLMQETADRFAAPIGDERVDPTAPPEAPPTPAAGEEAVEAGHDDGPDEVTDPEGHTHSSGGSLAWGGHSNGRIPASEMAEIGGGHRLETSAASAWKRMVADAKKAGITLSLTDSYRDFAGQKKVRAEKGHLVATAEPGTSVHGWGKAIDVSGDAARAWIQRNGTKYGWIWPDWAQKKGTKAYEPWHFEFRGSVPRNV